MRWEIITLFIFLSLHGGSDAFLVPTGRPIHTASSINTNTNINSNINRNRRPNHNNIRRYDSLKRRVQVTTDEVNVNETTITTSLDDNVNSNTNTNTNTNDMSKISSDDVMQQEDALFQSIQQYKDSTTTSTSTSTSTDETSIKPPREEFEQLIDAWLRFPSPDRAEIILDKMEEFYTPSGRIYERIINAWAFSSIESIEKLRMMDHDVKSVKTDGDADNVGDNDGDGELNDDDDEASNADNADSADSMNAADVGDIDIDIDMEEYEEQRTKQMKSLRAEAMDAADKSTALLDRMEQLCQEVGDDFRPALSTYTSCINAISRSSDKTDVQTYNTKREMVDAIRQKRDQIYNNMEKQHFIVQSNQDVFEISRRYLEGRDEKNCLFRQKFDIDGTGIFIGNRKNFNFIINALAQIGKPWAADAAEEILGHMIRKHTKDNRLTPNIETFNECINAWAKHSSSRAEGILEKLNDLQTKEGLLTHVIPDNVSYNTIIKSFANSGNALRAEATLDTMEQLYESTGDEKIKPDLISYGSVLNAFAKAAPRDPSAANKSEDILMRMLKNDTTNVNSWCFNAVLDAHASQGSGNRAFKMLQLMEDLSHNDKSLTPDTYSYNILLKALANSKEKGSVARAMKTLDKMEKHQDSSSSSKSAKPDVISYNTVILAIANLGGNGAGKRAKAVLKRMEDRFNAGDESVKPTSQTYTALIKAFSWEKDSLRLAEELVQSLTEKATSGQDSKYNLPDTPIYNALLNCYARSGWRNAAQRAEDIIEEMKMFTKPNTRTYATLIDVLSKTGWKRGRASRALEILDLMEKMYEDGDTRTRPNVYVYTSVINCIARSRDEEKAVMAVSVLQRMEEEYRGGNTSARPNSYAYNSVLNACAYTSGEAESIETAFKIACLVFDEVRTSGYVKPCHITYGTFLSVCANLMPDSELRDHLVEATFKRCAREGLVSNMVWKNLKHAASPTLTSELLAQASDSKLEANWSRNV